MLAITRAETEAQHQIVRSLVAEYIDWDASELRRLGLDARAAFEFYFASGEEAFPSEYASPQVCLLLAYWSGEPAGCVAFRRLAAGVCELKRLYVRPACRGKQIGRQLVSALIMAARNAGYNLMRLETVTYMEEAIALYSKLGFRRCPPYYTALESFKEISVFMELDLVSDAGRP
jgi:GNAT superfamily N-acetyltransferase